MNSKIPYISFSKFILRTPLFQFSFIDHLLYNDNNSEELVKDLCRNKIVQEAIYLASPYLYKEMIKWINGDIKEIKRSQNLLYSLTQYLLRMSFRCTPFGLFAGFSVGEWDNETKIVLDNIQNHSRHTRLDMNYICALALDLVKIPEIKNNIRFYPNSSIYKVGNKYRYVEYKFINARRFHHIVAVDYSDYLKNIFDVAIKGACLKDLSQIIVNDEVSYEEANTFIDELIDNQLLVSELEPAITGPEFLDQILNIIQGIENIDGIRQTLLNIKNNLQIIDESPIGETIPYYQIITDELKKIETKFDIKYLFQTDLIKKTKNSTLDKSLINDIFEGLDVLNKLTIFPPQNNPTKFRESFFEKYEEREIPLLQALDTESGIGYLNDSTGDINPLIDDVIFPITGGNNELTWNQVNSYLFGKYREALSLDKYEIELMETELRPFRSNWNDLPLTLSAMVQIIKEKDKDIFKNKIFIHITGGPSAANLLGRFCHADESLYHYVKEIIEKEKDLYPDVIFAEIIHLPESRLGNILLRPVLRDYEIPYLAKPFVESEFQIKLEDLMISIKNGRIFLRSKRLNKEIVPRLSSAHNYGLNGLPIYQFLCDLQTQNIRGGIGFNWGPLVNEYKFRPRVTYKNLIFSPATWIVKKEDIKDLIELKDNKKLLDSINEWRIKNKIPLMVLLIEADNELLLNLENSLCIKTLFSIIKNKPIFQLSESFYYSENDIVNSEEGNFNNQFIISFYKNHISKEKPSSIKIYHGN